MELDGCFFAASEKFSINKICVPVRKFLLNALIKFINLNNVLVKCYAFTIILNW